MAKKNVYPSLNATSSPRCALRRLFSSLASLVSKKRPELPHPHRPPLWRPWASPHLLFCLGSGGWGWRTAPPPAALRGRPPRALRVSLTRGPHSASPRGPPPPAPAPGPGRRRRDRSLSHTPPRRSSCPRRLSGAEPRGSRSFQPGPHFSQAGPEWATRAGESRPETLLQKRPARERPPALLHTNHAGDARASPAGPPPRSRPRSRRGAAHVLREHAPYNREPFKIGRAHV